MAPSDGAATQGEEHEVGGEEEEVVGGVEVDHGEEEEEKQEVRFGEQEASLHVTCMCSQLAGKSTSPYVCIVDKEVIGHTARPRHLANIKKLTNK